MGIVQDILDVFEKNKEYTFDVENNPEFSIDHPNFELYGISFASGDFNDYFDDLTVCKAVVQDAFKQSWRCIAFNAKYDLKVVKKLDWADYPELIGDPMIAVNLIDENRQPNRLGLKTIVLDLYKYQMMTFEQAHAFGPKSSEFHKYGKEDAFWELKLWHDFWPQLEKEQLTKLFDKLLMPASKAFADMELTGLPWDLLESDRLIRGMTTMREKVKLEIQSEIGSDLNLDSGDQLATRLFTDLKYSSIGISQTKSGKRLSVDAEAMDILAAKHPVCAKIRDYRNINKMLGTYLVPITERALDDAGGRIHPSVWMTSATGRSRMEDPNFQNVPHLDKKKYPGMSIRACVAAEPGKKIVVADLSQIELRIMAHVTEDPKLLKAYRDWQCTICNNVGTSEVDILHTCPKCGAAEDEKILQPKKYPGVTGFWHGLDLHQMTADAVPPLKGDRGSGKISNFALGYYASAYRMHKEHPVYSVDQWQEIINWWMNEYVGVKKWHIICERELYDVGVKSDIFGRKRRIEKWQLKSPKQAKHALNQFINFEIQAPACEYILLCLSKIRDYFIRQNLWQNGVWFINFVHDELVFEVLEEHVETCMAYVKHFLETTVKFKVPIRADVKVGANWNAAKE